MVVTILGQCETPGRRERLPSLADNRLHASLSMRVPATLDGLRQTVWLHALTHDPSDHITISAQVTAPGNSPVWIVGPWVFSVEMAKRAGPVFSHATEDFRVLDGTMRLGDRGLPVGDYRVDVYVEAHDMARRIVAQRHLSATWYHGGDPGGPHAGHVAKILAGDVDSCRRRLTSVVGDPDLRIADHGTRITGTTIKAALAHAWPMMKPGAIVPVDLWKWAVPLPLARYIVSRLGVQDREYIVEQHDCDDFARALIGAFHTPELAGGAWLRVYGAYPDGAGNHAMAAVICPDTDGSRVAGIPSVRLIEPQTGGFTDARDRCNDSGQWTPYDGD